MITFLLSLVISYWAYSNIFFAIPTYVKALTMIGISFLLINIVFDKAETILYWKDPEKRPVILNIKMKQSFIETIVVFFVNFIILIFSQFLGLLNFIYEHELNKRFISYYQPTFLETVLITLIIILSFIAIWTSMYWFAGRFLQIKEYSNRLKRFVLKASRVFIFIMILLVIFWAVLYIGDLLFIEVKVDGNFVSIEFLKDFTKKNYLLVLTVEIFILFGINLFFYFNGDKNLRERNNFILSDKEKSEIKSKKEKDHKTENKKDFKTLVFESLIVQTILLPFFYIFLLVWISNGVFIFFWISLGFMIFCYILIILLLKEKISIV
ncbi:MAG: hypothetical protein HWN81_02520 [Candidatus Lokiarchaeota archaeon]|nr:hypothetical protein [Candidatus Lokiarchaeota archaeon]